jgi:hypothetical protein
MLVETVGATAVVETQPLAVPRILRQGTEKHGPPQRRSTLWVRRERLILELDTAIHRPLTVLRGGPGWGKTSLLADWVRGSQLRNRLAWVSLDLGDNDWARFRDDVDAALRGLDLSVAKLETLEHPVVLILDDFGALWNPQVHDYLANLLNKTDRHFHLVISTRAEVPPALTPFQMSRKLSTEVTPEDLSFTLEEAASLLAKLDLTVDQETVRRLIARTEGWPAGLRLAASSLREQADLATLVAGNEADQRTVADYLIAEVLDRLPSHIRDFLGRISRIAGEFSADQAAEVGGEPRAQKILDSLARTNTFVVELGGEPKRYRLHALFAELLRSQSVAPTAPQSDSDFAVYEQRVLRAIQQEMTERLARARAAGRDVQELAEPAELARRMVAAMPLPHVWDSQVGPFYDTAGLCRWLGISRQAVHDRVRRRVLLAVTTSDGKTVYPAWQFDDAGQALPGMREVLEVFKDIPPNDWAVAVWLTTPDEMLGNLTPAQALRNMDAIDAVRRIAMDVAARWRW